jgi:hypothetical protein
LHTTPVRLLAASATLAAVLAASGCGGADEKPTGDAAGSQSATDTAPTGVSPEPPSPPSTHASGSASASRTEEDGETTDGSDSDTAVPDDKSEDGHHSGPSHHGGRQTTVPMPAHFPDDVPVVDGDVLAANHSQMPPGWSVTIRAGTNASSEYDAAARLLTGAGCKVEVKKADSGKSFAGQLRCGDYQVLLTTTSDHGVLVAYSVS